jgi:hypothetical protein
MAVRRSTAEKIRDKSTQENELWCLAVRRDQSHERALRKVRAWRLRTGSDTTYLPQMVGRLSRPAPRRHEVRIDASR